MRGRRNAEALRGEDRRASSSQSDGYAAGAALGDAVEGVDVVGERGRLVIGVVVRVGWSGGGSLVRGRADPLRLALLGTSPVGDGGGGRSGSPLTWALSPGGGEGGGDGVGGVDLVVDSAEHVQGYSGGIAASAVRGQKTTNLRTIGVDGRGLRTDVVDMRSSIALAGEPPVAPGAPNHACAKRTCMPRRPQGVTCLQS